MAGSRGLEIEKVPSHSNPRSSAEVSIGLKS